MKTVGNINCSDNPDDWSREKEDERERFITDNLPLVYAAAKRFRGRGTDCSELLQSGALGLIKAYDGYDAKTGVPFPSYAFKFIEGEIRNTLRKNSSVHLSRGARETAARISGFIEQYEMENSVSPDIGEISDALGIEKTDICCLINVSAGEISLNAECGESVCESLKSSDDTEKSAVFHTFRKQIIKNLSESEADVVFLRYEQDLTQLETAEKLNCSQSKVSKLEKSALLKIRYAVRQS